MAAGTDTATAARQRQRLSLASAGSADRYARPRGDRVLTVSRWTRYGHDRLYVNTVDGSRVGWFGLRTGQTHLEHPELAAEFSTALAAHRPRSGHPQPAQQPTAEAAGWLPGVDGASCTSDVGPATPISTAQQTEPGLSNNERDLASNRAGQGARAEADRRLVQARRESRTWAFLQRLVDPRTEERAGRKGAGGEETVGARLERLTARGWHVVHSIPVRTRGTDIDHLLIGPSRVCSSALARCHALGRQRLHGAPRQHPGNGTRRRRAAGPAHLPRRRPRNHPGTGRRLRAGPDRRAAPTRDDATAGPWTQRHPGW